MKELIKELDKKVASLRTNDLICPKLENSEWMENVSKYIEDKDILHLKETSADMLVNHEERKDFNGTSFLEDDDMDEIRVILNKIIIIEDNIKK